MCKVEVYLTAVLVRADSLGQGYPVHQCLIQDGPNGTKVIPSYRPEISQTPEFADVVITLTRQIRQTFKLEINYVHNFKINYAE